MNFSSALRILVLGCGDCGWRDEGLGPALAEAVGRLKLPGVSIDQCDALCIEHAATAAAHEIVIFTAGVFRGAEPFAFRALRPAVPKAGAAQRSIDPSDLLQVTAKLYGRRPEGYTLAVRGYEFCPGQELSEEAAANLDRAVEFLEAAIRLKLAA